MNSLHCTFFLLLAVAAAALTEEGNSDDEALDRATSNARTVIHEINLNNAFDKALPAIQRSIITNGMDPMEIPDVEIPLSHLPGLLKTKMILHKGHIQQLSTISRTGDIILQFGENKFSLYLNIGWETLDLSHEYSLRYILFTRKGHCYGRYDDVKASMLVDYDFQRRKINLKFLKFVSIGNFEIKLEGHLIDGFINLITKAVTKVFRTTILQMIEGKVYEEVEKKIDEINDLIPSPIDFVVIKDIVERERTTH